MTQKNYTALGSVSAELKDTGLFKAVLYPCNQFLGQEPGMPDSPTIKRMSTGKLDDVDTSEHVLVMEKVDVNGAQADPVWEFLRYNSSLYDEKKDVMTPIPWNFSKFLVDPQGKVYKYYGPKTDLEDLLPDIRQLLEGTVTSPKGRQPSIRVG